MDYKELLKKYMLHIVHQEGIDYIDRIYSYDDDGNKKETGTFTEREIFELKYIAEELMQNEKE